jgi:hypothetical protein
MWSRNGLFVQRQQVPHLELELIVRPETQRVPHMEQELIIRPEKHQVPNAEQELLIRPEYLELPPDSCCSKLNFLCNVS